MNISNSPHLQVAVDIGSHEHYVAIGLSEGGILDEFLNCGVRSRIANLLCFYCIQSIFAVRDLTLVFLTLVFSLVFVSTITRMKR